MITAAQKRRLFRDLNRVDHSFIDRITPFLDGLYKYYFRCEFTGWENVPEEKVLFVGNHNGLITFEVLMMFHAWWQRYGKSRRALGLAHSIALDNPLFRWICPRIGAIPADPDIAVEAMEHGYSLLVYPGGEKEAFRAYSERKQVDFYQRKGFIKLALKAKVPIVPIVSCGAQETYIILHRGEELAKKLGLYDKYRLHGMPITFRSIFFMWCVASGMITILPLFLAPFAFASIWVPMPAQMTFRILPKIDVLGMVDQKLSEEENLQRIYDHVIDTMQACLTSEYSKRKLPVLG